MFSPAIILFILNVKKRLNNLDFPKESYSMKGFIIKSPRILILEDVNRK